MARNDSSAAVLADKANENGNIRGTAIATIRFNSGILTEAQAEEELSALLTLFSADNPGKDDVEAGETGNDSPSRSRSRVFISDLLVEAGRLAVKFRLFVLLKVL